MGTKGRDWKARWELEFSGCFSVCNKIACSLKMAHLEKPCFYRGMSLCPTWTGLPRPCPAIWGNWGRSKPVWGIPPENLWSRELLRSADYSYSLFDFRDYKVWPLDEAWEQSKRGMAIWVASYRSQWLCWDQIHSQSYGKGWLKRKEGLKSHIYIHKV